MIQEFVQELGVLPRGLAHPVVFAGPDVLSEAAAQGGMAGNQDPSERAAGASQFGNLLSTYGAVPVSGRNMHKLLEQGEMVLLYPGGAREVRWLSAAVATPCSGVHSGSFACEVGRYCLGVTTVAVPAADADAALLLLLPMCLPCRPSSAVARPTS